MPDPDRPWETFGTRRLTDEERAFIEKHKDDIVPIDPEARDFDIAAYFKKINDAIPPHPDDNLF